MYGLLLRLSALDADAASAVRVIGFFDALVEQGATIDTVLRRTASLAECAVGVRTADGQLSERADPSGMVRFGEPPSGARVHRMPSGGVIWIERAGAPLPLDDLLIERFAIATTVALGRGARAVGELDPAALLRVAISPVEDESMRRRVLARLGIDPASVVHLAAIAGEPDAVDTVAGQLCGDRPRAVATSVDTIRVVLCRHPVRRELAVPVGTRVGLSGAHAALLLPSAWREARIALRYAQPSRHERPPYDIGEAAVVAFDQLGAFAAFAERLTAEEINEIDDVRRLDQVATDSGDATALYTLEVVAATGSLRGAASVLHLHHNSVAHRVARAERELGFSLNEPYARSRLLLALMLRRLRDSMDQF
jgi:hypothetical protein